ncbi:MAG: HipA domain-containing protein [Candidatus Omnitrophica bacterium]|nr:HipA domain-containing protein [Candidatus Omnitrophota bacterium]
MSAELFRKVFGLGRAPIIRLSLRDIPLKAQEMVGKMSISGVQPKLSVKLDKAHAELIAVAGEGGYILKPQTQAFSNTPENENCCMDIAESIGINVPPHCLLALTDGSLAYVVKRFDRDGQTKIHQETFSQILGQKDKYSGSVEQIGIKLKQVSSVPGLDVQLFFERVVFNFLIGNGDAHFKNYSISHHGGTRLSPAYDMVCSKLALPKGADSALTINGKDDKLTRKDFDVLADYLEIPPRVRYEKFVGKIELMSHLIKASRLPAEFRSQFTGILASRYQRLGI